MPSKTHRETKSARSETWQDQAACRSHPELPWVDNDAESTAICKKVCRSCSVRERCAAEFLVFVDHHGTVGGTSRAQRVWLRADPTRAEMIAAECKRDRVNMDKLYEWFVSEGPAALPSDAVELTERQIAVRYGVDVETFQKWLADRGLAEHSPSGPRPKMHVDAYELFDDHLTAALAEGDGWVPRSEITDLFEAVLPAGMIAHTETAVRSIRAGWDNLAMTVIQSRTRSGDVEQRPDPDRPNRRQIRLINQRPAEPS